MDIWSRLPVPSRLREHHTLTSITYIQVLVCLHESVCMMDDCVLGPLYVSVCSLHVSFCAHVCVFMSKGELCFWRSVDGGYWIQILKQKNQEREHFILAPDRLWRTGGDVLSSFHVFNPTERGAAGKVSVCVRCLRAERGCRDEYWKQSQQPSDGLWCTDVSISSHTLDGNTGLLHSASTGVRGAEWEHKVLWHQTHLNLLF